MLKSYHEIWMQRFRQRLTLLYGKERMPLLLKRLKMLIGRYGVGIDPRPCPHKWDQSTSVLITYADMIRNDGEAPLLTLKRFCDSHLHDAIDTVHILPFFPYTSDDGFSIVDYRIVNPDYGTWREMEKLHERFHLMFDIVLNHCSRSSDWFKQFVNGVMPGKDYFVQADPDTDVSTVTRPRKHPLLTTIPTRAGDASVWTTFSEDQVDLDFSNPDVLFEFLDILFLYIAKGARILRLDAIAYLWKELGTNCIHLPQTHEVVKLFREVLEMVAPEVLLLTETNVPHAENISYFGDGDEAQVVYNFSLPPLTLHALLTGNAQYLNDWASNTPPAPKGCTFLNFTASHDGVGVRPLEGLVPPAEVQALADAVGARGGKINYKSNPDGTESPYELNVTYFDALCDPGGPPTAVDIDRFLCSQTIAMSLRGIPAAYFHSLCGTRNWYEGVETLGHNRAINRMKWEETQLEMRLRDKESFHHTVFTRYLRRLKIRRGHSAFHPDGPQEVLSLGDDIFALLRSSASGGESILCLHNVTSRTVEAALPDGYKGVDLLEETKISGDAVALAPYQCRWIKRG